MQQNQRNPLEELADAFLKRYRHGERPALTEYTQKYPELAEEIRDLFPALVMMEEAGPPRPEGHAPFKGQVTSDGKALRRLGDYRILREVGRGGMGVVYEAEQESLGRHVAVKVLPFDVAGNPTCLKRFCREARAAARLHHTNIVPVFEVGEHDGLYYYAMQFIQGHGLDEVLIELRQMRNTPGTRRSPPPGRQAARSIAGNLLTGRFTAADLESEGDTGARGDSHAMHQSEAGSPESADASFLLHSSSFSSGSQADFHFYRSVARVGLQVAEALAYAHDQRVLHRDIKPANLLLDLHGTVWVTDFGLAKEEGQVLTKTGDVVGTLRYMAPERFNGVSDPRGDIYSLGLTLYELLTLQPAFDESDRGRLIKRLTQEDPSPPRGLDRRVPRDLETIVLKASAKEPDRRYQTAGELVEDLRRFLSDRPIQARRASWREYAWRWVRRNPGWAATLGIVLGLLHLIAIGGVFINFRLQRALAQTQAAEESQTEKLWRSYLEQARAERSSGRVGQRFEALKAIQEAARIRITPELRNEAVAALVLPDVQVAREWEGMTTDTLGVSFDAKFERYARLDRQGGITICRQAANGEEVLMHLPAHGRPPFGAMWMSPDGRILLCFHSAKYAQGGGSTGACGWRLDGANPVLWLDEPTGAELSVPAFSEDGRQAAVGRESGAIAIYDLGACEVRQRLEIPPGPNRLAFDPQGKRLAASCGAVVRIFDLPRGKELSPLRHAASVPRVTDVAWHPDGRRLATGCEDQKIHIWDVETAAEIMPPWTGHSNIGIALAFNHTGDRLVSDDWNAQTRLWDAMTGRLLLTLPGAALAHFSPDDQFLGPQFEGTKLRLLRVATGEELRVFRRRHADRDEQIHAVALDSTGRLLGVSSGTNWLTFFDLERGEQVVSLPMPGREAAWLRPCYETGWLTDGSSGLLHWPMKTVESGQWAVGRGQNSNVTGLEEEMVSERARSTHKAPLPTAHDPLPTTVCIGPPERLGPASVHGASASLDGRVLAIPQRNGAVILDRRVPERRIFVGPQNDVRTCAVSPDGRWVATSTYWWDGQSPPVRIWDAHTGTPVRDLALNWTPLVVFSPDGRWLATHTANEVRLWEAGTWREGPRFHGGSVVFSNDGRLLAVSDVFGVIRLVDTSTWQEIVRLTGPEATWYAPAAFSSDGTRLVALPKDRHAVYVWDLRQLRQALRQLDLDWEWPEFGPAAPPSTPPRLRVDTGMLGPVFENEGLAVALWTLALASQPFNTEAYYQRGLAYGRQGEGKKALADYNRFLALAPARDPRWAEILFRRANSRAVVNDFDGALDDLFQLSALACNQIIFQDDFGLLCNNVAWHYVMEIPKSGFPGQALNLAQKSREIDPYNGTYENTLGGVYYRLGRYADAIRCLEDKLKKSPEYAAFDLYLLAMSYARLGQVGTGRSCYERANDWWTANPGLPAAYPTELTALRGEAAAVLGLQTGGNMPANDKTRPAK
jgi:serine/threonine protein kinase/WD40 repeat protein